MTLALRYPDTEAWRVRAACRHWPKKLFFPNVGRGGANTSDQAKSLCWRCPVRSECLAYALETKQEAGIWGGKTWAERKRLLGLGKPLKRAKVQDDA